MTSVPSTPQRHQRKRTKGWKAPENAIYVGRPSMWGNAFVMESEADRDDAVVRYRHYIEHLLEHIPTLLDPLRGRDLLCWCRLDKSCHADVLLELANR